MLKIQTNNQPIYNFTIYAERHCGTNFLTKYLPTIFDTYKKGRGSLPVTWEYGWKHFFGFKNDMVKKGSQTLFIGIVREPYDWLYAMKRMPHHLRAWNGRMDNNPYKNSTDFFTSEIISMHKGKELDRNHHESCDHHMHENRRYKNIFELRETKNIFLLDTMPTIAQNYILINYESLHQDINTILNKIKTTFNIKFKRAITNHFDKKPYSIDSNDLQIITDNLCWSTENRLGYYPR